MNVEKTIEFILNSQARAEARMDKTDKRIDAIGKLVQQGMRILVRIESAQKRNEARVAELAQAQKELAQAQKKMDADLRKSLAELAEAQKETQRSLKAFLHSMRHRRNGA